MKRFGDHVDGTVRRSKRRGHWKRQLRLVDDTDVQKSKAAQHINKRRTAHEMLRLWGKQVIAVVPPRWLRGFSHDDTSPPHERTIFIRGDEDVPL